MYTSDFRFLEDIDIRLILRHWKEVKFTKSLSRAQLSQHLLQFLHPLGLAQDTGGQSLNSMSVVRHTRSQSLDAVFIGL